MSIIKLKNISYFAGLLAVLVFVYLAFLDRSSIGQQQTNDQSEGPKATTTPAQSPSYKKVMTTLFWIGERSDESNDFIPNHESYWDSDWLSHYGGVDSPDDRCDYYPCDFTPKENPFYFALPYGDRDDEGDQKETVKLVPWYLEKEIGENVLKNAWIEIKYRSNICYAQWEDVGPNEMDDFEYVFGSAEPKNTFGVSAGLDISPAVWDCLGLTDNSVTEWRFVREGEVPEGPWKLIVTSRGVSF